MIFAGSEKFCMFYEKIWFQIEKLESWWPWPLRKNNERKYAIFSVLLTVKLLINPGVYSNNRQIPPAFSGVPACESSSSKELSRTESSKELNWDVN